MPDMSFGISTAIGIGSALMKDNAIGDAQDALNAGIENALGNNRQLVSNNNTILDEIKKIFQPFIDSTTGTFAGGNALTAQGDLLGLNGGANQQYQLDLLQQSPIFQGLMKQGENSILQNASATGGLRGGNVQRALGQFSPNLLNTLVNQRLQGLDNVIKTGFGATGATAQAMGNFADLNSRIGLTNNDLYTGQGRVNAGAEISKANNWSGMLKGIGQGIGNNSFFGTGNGAMFGGGGGFGGSDPTGTFGADMTFGMF